MKPLFILFVFLSFQLFAQTTNWRENRLKSLEKVTVGPSDNYQSALLLEEKTLYFTRNKNQISQLYRQDLTTGETKRLFDANTDAKDPSISPDGKWLAMTNFRFDAQGDICLYSLVEKQEIKCLTDKKDVEHSPFWIDANQLGYIRRSMLSNSSELVIKNILDNTEKVLLSENITAPTASPDSRYLAYHLQGKSDANGIYIYDLKEHNQFGPLPLALPGISSNVSFSTDSKYLYFGHYLNDTSSDQNIDGEDHSVVFRVEIDKALKSKESILPEQLISVAQNCNFPTLTDKYLYVTCAYEGSLDIYRLSTQGVVPAQWSKEQIEEAHQNAVSYEDRLLLLNALHYRFTKNTPASLISFYERKLSNHLEIGELSATLYFVKKLEKLNKQKSLSIFEEFYHNLAILLELRSDAFQQPPGLLTATFKKHLKEKRKSLGMIHRSSGGMVFSAWIDSLLENNLVAQEKLNSVWQYDEELIPLAYFLAIELNQYLLEDEPKLLLARFLDACQKGTIDLQSRLYYAFNYLKTLETVQKNIDARILTIDAAMQLQKEQKIKDLFLNEIDVLKLIKEKESAQKSQIFRTLTNRLKSFKDQDIRRLAHIRAIRLFGAASEYKFMELLSRHWLIVSNHKEIAFADVAQQYAIITMNKAYGVLNGENLNSAANIFYSAIRQTNDLEAHYSLLAIAYTSKNSALLERVENFYQVLQNDNLIGSNENFVKALKLILEDPSESLQTLSQAAALLESSKPAGLSPAVHALLLGYVYHRQLLHQKERYSYNIELYQKAHYQYMLALDQGYDNQRVQSAVLENLGHLHFSVGNYGMSGDFFAERIKMPFMNVLNEADLRWHFTRTLFYNNNLVEAAQQAEIALSLIRESDKTADTVPFLEQAAFYNMQAANYKKAIVLYEKLLEEKKLKDENLAKALLGYGYSLLKFEKFEKAKKIFQKLLRHTSALKSLPIDSQRLVSFEPKRLELLAYGFLLQCSKDSQEKVELLNARISILNSIKDRVEEFAYDEKGRLEFLIKALNQEAIAYEKNNSLDQMLNSISLAVELLPKYLEAGGGENSQAIFHTLTNYLSLALLYPEKFKNKDVVQLKSLVKKTINGLSQLKYRSPINIMQQYELEILYYTFKIHILEEKLKKDLEILMTTIQNDPNWTTLNKEHSDLARELKEMIKWVESMH